MKHRMIALATAGGVAVSFLVGGAAQAHQPAGALQARSDAYLLSAGHALNARESVLGNDNGGPVTIASHTDPAHGTLSLNSDGTFRYSPAPGFTGVDSFTYTVSNAVRLYRTHLPPLATIGGVKITGGA
jgi:hypothetical protein